MSRPDAPVLDQAILEVRYSRGHAYFDRSGQTLVELEQMDPEWMWDQFSSQATAATKLSTNTRVAFSNVKFDLVRTALTGDGRTLAVDTDQFIADGVLAWKVINANLGLDEYTRIGLRLIFFLPKRSTEHAEAAMGSAILRPMIPDELSSLQVKARQTVVVFSDGPLEYRVELGGIVRHEGLPPTPLMTQRPEQLPKHQREYRNRLFSEQAKYGRNPKYAVKLDVDCAQSDPPKVDIAAYVKQAVATVRQNFLPILERL